jgi:tRNA nucleotidyltransferase (CCA-adding enzyme)
MSMPAKPIEDLAGSLARTHPELAVVRERSEGERVYLIGGAVRDLLLGRARADIDLVVEGDAARLAARLGADYVEHGRFGTVKIDLEGHEVDIATARTEVYPHPGALPEVKPSSLAEDLARRDFTINAMAIPLEGEPRLIDPRGGRGDLRAGLLRVLHPASFADDPSRALRAARYAARFDFALEPETAELLSGADLTTVSLDRRRAELLRLAAEPKALRGFELAIDWGLIDSRAGGLELATSVSELIGGPPWGGIGPAPSALLAALLGPPGSEAELAAAEPERPSEAVELARGHTPVELVLARALGAQWLDLYLTRWRSVRLEIDGGDLIAAGIPEGPALGHGLSVALQRKLDGEIEGHEQELAAALVAARTE